MNAEDAMKLVAIVGTNAELSYNRFLLQWMRTHFAGTADIDVLEIGQLPAFNEDLVTAEQEGRYVRYRAEMPGINALLAFLTEDCCSGNPERCTPKGKFND